MAKDEPKQAPSHGEKTLSVRLPKEKHKSLKYRCAVEGITIRSVILAVITELEKDSPSARKILAAAAEQGA